MPRGRPALRAARQAAKLSQVRLARLAGIDRSYLASIESGSRDPSADALMRLSAALGVDPRDLFPDMAASAVSDDAPAPASGQ